ncbi:MAG: hypothetical protein JRJ02_12810, partial [Deltaproteobacteria bacterium]|nr:hypothetical protein [Deltaproteobacteria bacterium]
MMKKSTYLTLIILIAFSVQDCFATQWAKTYGGSGSEGSGRIQQTRDGGYIVAGQTESFGAGESDIWVLKLDSTG